MSKNIAVVGTGYVGLVAAACFAKRHNVTCVDIDERKVELINAGVSPFFEPQLDELISAARESGRIFATSNINAAIEKCDFVFICVGTPSAVGGSVDLRYIEQAAADIGKALANIDHYIVVVQRSTVPPQTTRHLVGHALEKNSGKENGKDFGLAFVPEFLREGNAVYDFLFPDRIVIGTDDDRVARELFALYTQFNAELSSDRIFRTTPESAELIKYASNSFLATKISFANELASIAECIPCVDIRDVVFGMGLDNRINPKFFGAGAGFGGSCFPKDVKGIVHFSRTLGIEPFILDAVLKRNAFQASHVADIVERALDGRMAQSRIAILGLSFKPDTSDMREAPSLHIIGDLIERGAKNIIGCDPQSTSEAREILGDRISYCDNVLQAIESAHVAVIVTEWREFCALTPEIFIERMAKPCVVDARRIFDAHEFSKKLEFYAIGFGK